MAQATAGTDNINELPDSAFALVEPGGRKDAQGRTSPHLRHFPIHNRKYTADSLARVGSANLSEAQKSQARGRIVVAAKKHGIAVDEAGDRSLAELAGETERRYLPCPVETRTGGDGSHIIGYAATFNVLSRNLGGFVERVEATAFNDSRMKGWPEAVCRYDHDSSMLLGTTAGRTLDLTVDATGLFYDVIPPQSRSDILELVARGDVRHSSFAFRVPPGGDSWEQTDQSYPMRSLHEVQLVDVAPVLQPAYVDSTAGLRSLAMQVGASVDEVRRYAEKDELRKFFIRTDRASAAKPRPASRPSGGMFGPAAALELLRRRQDPWADQG